MPGYATALNLAAGRLKFSNIDTPMLDARLLLQAVCGLTRAELLMKGDEEVPVDILMIYGNLINRRAAHEPVARILGVREFWGLPFRLSAGTLEPRPDSETLIEAALYEIGNKAAPLRLLDLGTGSGCLLAALLHELPNAKGLAIDKNPLAVETARNNLIELGFDERAEVREGDWGVGLEGPFDIIISNPPYISEGDMAGLQPEVTQHDPRLALVAGVDGLDCYKLLAEEIPRLLHPQGFAVLELGAGQGPAVGALMVAAGLEIAEIKHDLNDIPRAMVLNRQKK